MNDELNQAVEELADAVRDLIDSIEKALNAWARVVAESMRPLFDLLKVIQISKIELTAAIEFAKDSHPEWVHIYHTTKKKRTRKKYEKKILQHWRDSQ